MERFSNALININMYLEDCSYVCANKKLRAMERLYTHIFSCILCITYTVLRIYDNLHNCIVIEMLTFNQIKRYHFMSAIPRAIY